MKELNAAQKKLHWYLHSFQSEYYFKFNLLLTADFARKFADILLGWIMHVSVVSTMCTNLLVCQVE